MKKADRITGIILILFSVYFTVQAYSYGLFNRNGQTGAGLVPFIVGLLLLLLSVILLLQSFAVDKTQESKETANETNKPIFPRESLKNCVLYIACLCCAVFASKFLGLVIPLFFMILTMILFARKSTFKRALIVALFTTAIIFLIFAVLLRVPVPTLFIDI